MGGSSYCNGQLSLGGASQVILVFLNRRKINCMHFRYPTMSAGSRSTVEDLILDRFDTI